MCIVVISCWHLLIVYLLFLGVVLCGSYIQDSQGDQPMADGTFLLKIKIYLSISLEGRKQQH